MTRSLHRALPALFIGLLLLAIGTPVAGQEQALPVRTIGVATSEESLLVSFDYRTVISSKIQEKLRSGLPTRIILQINLEQKGMSTPLAYFARSCTIVYDLWEEVFVVSVEDYRGKRHAKVKTEKEAIDLVTSVANEKVAKIVDRDGEYRMRVLVEVNPVSKEMVANIRKWLSRSTSDKGTGQTNYFGSFVGIFVDRRIGQADRTMSFVSQWFRVSGAP